MQWSQTVYTIKALHQHSYHGLFWSDRIKKPMNFTTGTNLDLMSVCINSLSYSDFHLESHALGKFFDVQKIFFPSFFRTFLLERFRWLAHCQITLFLGPQDCTMSWKMMLLLRNVCIQTCTLLIPCGLKHAIDKRYCNSGRNDLNKFTK